ncbi:hypothetical protein NC652_027760 [Populus alba x Populus x berolinensis]|nr:hypothetical protein NC652_027760 [Populus alba x Populus x berolinensis]
MFLVAMLVTDWQNLRSFASKEIELSIRNARLRTMEAFMIILSATQLLYIAAIHGASSSRRT